MDLRQAQDRVLAIRAAMEKLVPGSTGDNPALRGGFTFTPAGSAGGWRYDVSVSSSGDGQHCVSEGSWNPGIGPISASGATIHEDERPLDAARRLLKC